MRAFLTRFQLGKDKEASRQRRPEYSPSLAIPQLDLLPTDPDVHRKVAFISPPQSPIPAILDRDLPLPPQQEPVPEKTTLSRFQVLHADKSPPPLPSSSSKLDLSSSQPPPKPSATRPTSPYLQRDVLSPQSFRSATPYSTMSAHTSGSRILAAASWSELTEDDLVSNIGSRERTRQEVLFEIISSEERYVPSAPSPISPS